MGFFISTVYSVLVLSFIGRTLELVLLRCSVMPTSATLTCISSWERKSGYARFAGIIVERQSIVSKDIAAKPKVQLQHSSQK